MGKLEESEPKPKLGRVARRRLEAARVAQGRDDQERTIEERLAHLEAQLWASEKQHQAALARINALEDVIAEMQETNAHLQGRLHRLEPSNDQDARACSTTGRGGIEVVATPDGPAPIPGNGRSRRARARRNRQRSRERAVTVAAREDPTGEQEGEWTRVQRNQRSKPTRALLLRRRALEVPLENIGDILRGTHQLKLARQELTDVFIKGLSRIPFGQLRILLERAGFPPKSLGHLAWIAGPVPVLHLVTFADLVPVITEACQSLSIEVSTRAAFEAQLIDDPAKGAYACHCRDEARNAVRPSIRGYLKRRAQQVQPAQE